MSDITGPPVPKAVSTVSHGTDRAAKTSRDPNQTPRQTTDDSGENKSKSEQREHVQVRDPAVSIAATAAHLRVGEELKEHVREIDAEGRPIIVTESATFALRPDAGLKPGDDVVLQVTETGKSVAADLLKQNERVIDPPIRLSLIVIAVHTGNAAPTANQPDVTAETLEVAYRPSRVPSTSTTALNQSTGPIETETLAKVLTHSNALLNTTPKTTEVADNPDPLVKSNSKDLATLIAAQQSSTAATTLTPQKAATPTNQTSNTAAPTPSAIQSGTSTHIIQPTPLTDPVHTGPVTPTGTPQPAAIAAPAASPPVPPAPPASTAGLGPAIAALSLSGQSMQIQMLDLSVSQVSPAEVAQVISVQALSPEVARTLPVGAQALGNEALSRLETSLGTFVLPQSSAQMLAGEHVRISTPDTTAPQAQQTNETPKPQAQPPETYNARLTAPGAQSGRQVQVQLIPTNAVSATAASTSQSHILTTADAIHTTRAFLAPDGPKSDLRIETQFGALTMTVPAASRPAAGDSIAILPQSTPPQVAQVPPIPVAASDAAALSTTSWPTFEQAYSLVQSGAPAAAGALQARSAQGGGKLLNSMMFLMAALKGGSPSGWIGKTAEQVLEQRSGNILKLLKDDLTRLFNAGAETATEWRSMVLPFDTRAPDMPILTALFSQAASVDPDGENDTAGADDGEEEPQRFIIEVQFSILGAIQLDGVVRQKKFDLTLWSHQPLPAQLNQDARALFAQALEANGFSGAMHFRESDTFPVDVAAILEKQLAA